MSLIYSKLKKVIGGKVSQLLSHYGFKRYLKNTGWMFFGQMASIGSSLLVSIFLARYLGPQKYGLMSYAISFAVLFAFLAGFGIDSVLSRELVKNLKKYNEYLGTGFVIKLLGAFLCILVISLSTYIFRVDYFSRALIIIFSLSFIFQASYVTSTFFNSQVQARKSIIAQIVFNIISSVIKLVMIYFGLDVFWFVVAYGSDAAILGFCYFVMYKANNFKVSNWKFDYGLAKDFLRDSWPLMFSSLAVTIYMKIDQVMIKSMMNDSAVGIYTAAVKVSEVWYFIPYMICGSLFPAIINAQKGDPSEFTKRLRKLYSLMFWLSFIIAVGISLSANFIIKILFGTAYISAAPVLRVHVWSGVGIFLGVAVTQYLISENYSKIFFLSTSVSAVINIILNLILIPKIGIMGAAVATLISYLCTTFFIVFFKKSRQQVINIFYGVFFRI